MPILGWMVAAYLIGSIPVGLLISKTTGGIDPRKGGSRNIGATNVLRTVGKKAALFTLVGDLLKGLLPVAGARWFGLSEEVVLFTGFAVILGHLFPIFLRLKGGKGVATSFGVFLILAPSIALISLLIWIVGFYLSKYSSVGALSAFGALPFVVFLLKSDIKLTLFASIISILVYIRHKE
ncbi:MAG: glycerol-3-phosphate 1-O-acyltransferase PlsY, partial [Candidatus Manganitrophaceae bacterium]